MRIHATLLHALLPLLLSAVPAVAADRPTAAGTAAEDLAAVQRRIRDFARSLAKEGFTAELALCFEGLAAAGAGEKDLAALRGITDKLLARAKPPRQPERALARHADTAADLAARLAGLATEQQRADLAAAALRFDRQNEQAQQVLGRVRSRDGAWCSPEVAARHERHHEFELHLQQALQLEIPLEPATPAHPLMVKVLDGSGSAWRHEGLTIESAWPAAKLAAVFRDVLRAMAFSRWLYDGELSPRHTPGLALHLPRPQYQRLVEQALTAELIDEPRRKTAHLASTTYLSIAGGGPSVYEAWATVLCGREGFVRAGLFKYYDDSLPGWSWDAWQQKASELPLWAALGHKNLAALACLDAPLPSFVLPEADGWTAMEAGEEEPEYSLARAGLVGGRLWLQQQAAAGTAGSVDLAMMEDVSRIAGLKLLAATSACEMLHQEGTFTALLKSYAKLQRAADTTSLVRRSEQALGQSVPEFMQRWRAWMLPTAEPASLRDLLLAPREPASTAEDPVITRFDELRRFVGLGAVPPQDAELSRGAAVHAAHLQNSTEEDPAGTWAGRHSLIAATGGAPGCIDAWLATFYHRLPLLHPGLKRIGLGRSGEICVLDVESVVDPAGDWWLPYPYPGQTRVPLRHGTTPPNPVPERDDQTTLGYPITLQLGPKIQADDMTMTLQKVDGKTRTDVTCSFATPTQPTRPDLAPDGVWCLIPATPLQPQTTYRVHVVVEGVERAWEFKTSG